MKHNKATIKAIETWQRNCKDGGAAVSSALCRWVERVTAHSAFASGRMAWCGVCGQTFATDKTSGRIVCPHCGSRLDITKTRRRQQKDECFVQELTAWGEYQVVRTYYVDIYCRQYNRVSVSVYHAYDWLFSEDGKHYCFARHLTMFPAYRRCPFSLWDVDGFAPMSFRKNAGNCDWYSGWSIRKHYPRRRVQPWAVKYALDGHFGHCDIFDILNKLTGENAHFETVWKMRNLELCRAFMYSGAEQWWRQIKIALRHGFQFTDWKMWRDYMQMMEGEGYDINNPNYAAPADLKAAHGRVLAERQRRIEREERERDRLRKIAEAERSRALKDPNSPLNEAYRERLGKVLAVAVASGNIVIKPLQDIRDFYEEGRALHHCVYENKYYAETGCLILGARVDGKRTETIELNLRTMQIEQCRGKYNQDSKYHEAIYSLMEKSAGKFRIA